MRPVLFPLIFAAVVVIACQRDPGRDVEPMADPLQTGPVSTVPQSAIIRVP
jgi:hypothetical protein